MFLDFDSIVQSFAPSTAKDDSAIIVDSVVDSAVESVDDSVVESIVESVVVDSIVETSVEIVGVSVKRVDVESSAAVDSVK